MASIKEIRDVCDQLSGFIADEEVDQVAFRAKIDELKRLVTESRESATAVLADLDQIVAQGVREKSSVVEDFPANILRGILNK